MPVVLLQGNELGLTGRYDARDVCAILHAESARVLGTYGGEFYEGSPALTGNCHGHGRAYYLAARMSEEFLRRFYEAHCTGLGIRQVLEGTPPPPKGVSVTCRTDGTHDYVFLLNFGGEPASLAVPEGEGLTDQLTGEPVGAAVELERFGLRILRRQAEKRVSS